MTVKNYVSAQVELEWDKALQLCNNPLGLTNELVQESLEKCPPIEYEGATFLGRYLIPRSVVRYDGKMQPRHKGCDTEHVSNLFNNFSVIGYRQDCHPPIASFDANNLHVGSLIGHSGFNRFNALDRMGQDCYIYDLYKFESRYHEVLAASESNHHSNPHLEQSKEDYIKVVTSTVNAGIVADDKDSIDKFVDRIAKNKTPEIRKQIKKRCYNSCGLYPNFRVYNSTGKGKNTLNGFVSENGFASQGIGGRTDTELQKQGYLLYTADCGDAVLGWSRGVYQSTRLGGLPVWLIGYATNYVPDLEQFRKNFIEEFNEMKTYFKQFAANILADGHGVEDMDETIFPIKLAGFLPQYVRPNDQNYGQPTESGLVDVYGNTLKFDPDGDCLTLTQP